MFNDFQVVTTIDALGLTNKRIGELKEEAEGYKSILIGVAANEPGSSHAFQGTDFRATVTFADRTTVNWEAIARELAEHVSHQAFTGMIQRHTKVLPLCPSVRVTKRSD